MTSTALRFPSASPAAFLGRDDYVDTANPNILALARDLRARAGHTATATDTDDATAYARTAFEWVRDAVAHSYDARDPRVTLTAAEVLAERVGLCYAKAHLLAALLRCEGIPAGLCYQRLEHGDGHVLHGLVAVHLDGAWHRQDPRGNTGGIDAQLSLGTERLAWAVDPARGEVDYLELYATPARCVVDTLRGASNVLDLYDGGLPTGL
ncbi:transglutaminase domain-containing protein [Tomitella fengzijianii]|uniref:Transglutaminase n=1 Tax=Tomitella fengzijianii TaxID=2597660 RepID=A0A516X1I9_9ACTN|nr:transglutaminase domain-containing protein [Tomitella fengzijianii]QDQ96938.1 transglutaminase [Tomitella fengzijianii]